MKIAPVLAYLATQSNERIFLFQDILSQKLYLLDGQKYAKNIGKNAYGTAAYFSGDEFLLKKPTKILKDKSFKPLLYLAEDAYFLKNKNTLNRLPAYNYETFFNVDGWGEKAIKV